MKYIKNSLTVIAFVVAGFTAFAFNAPATNEAEMRFTKLENGQWIPAEDDHRCRISNKVCTAQLVNNDPQLGQIVPGSEIEGTYSLNP